MKNYRCRKCEYHFCSDNGMPYCPACDCEDLEELLVEEITEELEMESHHIHPKFMGNSKGDGKQFLLSKRNHDILHGLIMKWLWEEVEDKERAIRKIIGKSERWIKLR